MAAMQRKQVEEPLAARLLRGAIGGVLAGLVFVGVTMWFAHSTGGTPYMPLRMISTIVKGDAALAAGTTSPALGGVVHVVLSALFGMVFALAVPVFRTNGTVALAGTVYGLLLYVVNFLVLTPWSSRPSGTPTSRSRSSPTWCSARCWRLRSLGPVPAGASRC